MPVISRAFRENDQKEVKEIYVKSAINNLIIGALIFIGLWINLDNIFALIPKTEVYSLGKMVVLIIGGGKIIDMAAGVNGEIIVMSKHYRVNVYLVVVLAIVTVLLNYILIPIYGLSGAAIGSTLALLFFNFSKFLFLKAKLNMQPFTLNTLKVIAISATALFIGLWLPRIENIYVDIITRSTLVTIVYCLAIYFTQASKEINSEINKFFNRHK
jgi:O-antigen/teichoic acid export membrane protein